MFTTINSFLLFVLFFRWIRYNLLIIIVFFDYIVIMYFFNQWHLITAVGHLHRLVSLIVSRRNVRAKNGWVNSICYLWITIYSLCCFLIYWLRVLDENICVSWFGWAGKFVCFLGVSNLNQIFVRFHATSVTCWTNYVRYFVRTIVCISVKVQVDVTSIWEILLRSQFVDDDWIIFILIFFIWHAKF